MKEICICAAVRASDGYIVRGHRHAHAMWTLHMIPAYSKEHIHPDNQGFITSRNRFVGRKEGCKLQIAAGIPSALEGTPYSGSAYAGHELFSEDLY